MIITCKQCATGYYLDEDRIKPSGTKVKCSKCQHLFVAFPPSGGETEPSTISVQTSGIPPAAEPMPTSPLASSLTESKDNEMSNLAAGLDELLGTDTTTDQSLAQSDEELSEKPMEPQGADEIEDQEMHDLTDELDKILGSGEMDGHPPETTGEDPIAETVEPDIEQAEDLESSLLDDEFDQVFGNQGGEETDKSDSVPGAYDTNIEMLDLSELDDELDEMFKPEMAADTDADDETTDDISTSEAEIDLDTIQIQDLDSELENIEEITSDTDDEIDFDISASDDDDVLEAEQINALGIDLEDSLDIDLEDLEVSDLGADETDLEKDLAQDESQDENNFLDTRQIDNLDLDLDLEYLDAQESEASGIKLKDDSGLDDDFVLDTKQIRNLDLELDLEDLETSESATEDPLTGEDSPLDTLQIEGLDLEFDDLDTAESAGEDDSPEDNLVEDDDLILNTLQVEGLDLELEELETPEPAEEENVSLDTEQIRSLDLELEDIDTAEPTTDPEDNFDKDASITLDTDKGKQAEVLNVNLERPDLDEEYNFEDEEIDLPILDELLAPAEVIDESLLEESDDDQLTLPVEDKPSEDDFLKPEEEDFLAPDKEDLLAPESLAIEEIEMEKEAEAEAPIQPEASAVSDLDINQDDSIRMEAKAESTVEPATDTFTPVAEAAAYPKKKSRKSLIVILLIALLLAGLYAITALGIKVPYLSDLMGSNTQQTANDPGTVQLKTEGIDSKFIASKKSGRLFVITGKVINQYDHARGFIQIKGNIFAKGGRLIQAKSVYCGNFLSDLDLGAKPLTEMQAYLSNKLGASGADSLKVKPGKTLPFMIVFADLPADIEEFSIEFLGSASL